MSRIANGGIAPWLLLCLGLIAIAVSDFDTHEFSQRTIGITTLMGINATARNSLYLGAVLSTLGALLIFAGYRPALPKAQWPLRAEPNLVAILLCISLLNLALYLYRDQAIFAGACIASLLSLLAVALYRIANRSADTRPGQIADHVISAVLISYSAALAIPLATGWPGSAPAMYALIGGLGVASAAMIVHFNWLSLSYSTFRTGALLIIGWPLLWVVGKELSALTALNAPLCAGLFAFAAALIAMNGYRDSHHFTTRWLFPLLLISNVVMLEYRATVLNFHEYDYYHMGEMVVPVQQLLQFGEMPFIDFYPIHGLFDMLPQLFYAALRPEATTESLVWGQGYMMGWLPRALSVLLIYSLLRQLLTANVALLSILLLPGYHLIHPYYSLLLMPALCLLAGPQKLLNWWLCAAATAFLMLWRVDFGIAASIGLVGVLLLYQRDAGWSAAARGWLPLLATALVALVVFCLLSLSRQQEPLTALLRIVHYLQAQTVTASWPAVFKEWNANVVVQYFLFPLTAILHLVIAFKGESNGSYARSNLWRYLMVYFSLLCLVLGLRSLHRHSLYVGNFNPYLYQLLAVMLLFYWRRLSPTSLCCLILAAIALGSALTPKRNDIFDRVYYNFGIDREYAAIVGDYPATVARLLEPVPPSPRLSTVPDKPLPELLRAALTSNATFYDFTNSSLLYALSGKRLPVFLMENIYQSSDPIQLSHLQQLEAELDAETLPLVIFQRQSRSPGVDGVANEVRSYRLAEFIFQHYQPCLDYDGYQLWGISDAYCQTLLDMATEIDRKRGENNIASVNNEQQIALMRLPWVWANRDAQWRAGESLSLTLQTQSDVRHQLSFGSDAKPGGSAYLLLEVDSVATAELAINWSTSRLSMRLEPGRHEYLLRLGIVSRYWQRGLHKLELDLPQQASLVSAKLIEAD